MNPLASGPVPQQQQSSSLAGSIFPQQPNSPTWGGASPLSSPQHPLGSSPGHANSAGQHQPQLQQQTNARMGLTSSVSAQQLSPGSAAQGAARMPWTYQQQQYTQQQQQQQQQQQYQQQLQGTGLRSPQHQFQQQPRVNGTGSPQTASYPLDITSTLGSSRELSGSSATSLAQAHAQSSPLVPKGADLAAMRAGTLLSACVVSCGTCHYTNSCIQRSTAEQQRNQPGSGADAQSSPLVPKGANLAAMRAGVLHHVNWVGYVTGHRPTFCSEQICCLRRRSKQVCCCQSCVVSCCIRHHGPS